MSTTSVALINALQEYLCICRPKDYLAFSIKYMQDEKAENPTMAHTLHSLIFLVDSPDEFLSAACTIYCNKLGEYYNSGESSLKSFLDGPAVAELVRGLELGSIWFEVSAVDEIVYDRMAVLKRVDFNIFVSLLRFPIACYQLQWWLRDELTALESSTKKSSPNKSSSTSTTSGGSGNNSAASQSNRELMQSVSSKLSAESTIDLLHLKHFMQRSNSISGNISSSNSSIARRKKNCSSSIHFQGSWCDEDARIWTRVLLLTIEQFFERNISATTVGVLCNEFIRKFISII